MRYARRIAMKPMTINDLLNKPNSIPVEKRDLPVYIYDFDKSINAPIYDASAYNSSKPVSKANPFSISYENY